MTNNAYRAVLLLPPLLVIVGGWGLHNGKFFWCGVALLGMWLLGTNGRGMR